MWRPLFTSQKKTAPQTCYFHQVFSSFFCSLLIYVSCAFYTRQYPQMQANSCRPVSCIQTLARVPFSQQGTEKFNRSECDHLLQSPSRGGKGTVINRRRPIAMNDKGCDVLRAQRWTLRIVIAVDDVVFVGYKDGTRTIEMILVSTVLTLEW